MFHRKLDSLRARWWRLTERPRLPRYRSMLADCLSQYPGLPVIAFPPGLGWQTSLFQRPQQLALALARRGALVFYLEPEHLHLTPGFYQEQERLFRCHVPIETFASLDRLWVYGLTWSWMFVERFGPQRVIYDVVDHLHAFPGDQQILKQAHERLARTAALVLTTSDNIQQQVSAARPDANLCPNGVDYEHFLQARMPTDAPPPADLAPILVAGKPVVGYSGALAAWVDYELLAQVADRCPGFSFVLIGPDHDHSLPGSLLALPNVHWLGVKPYADLPGYLRCFDVATIPFRLNEITHATSPIKLFEYMAAGKPIVTTPMQECRKYPEVLIAGSEAEFTAKLSEALALRTDPIYLQALDQRARQNTWDIRANMILQLMSAAAV